MQVSELTVLFRANMPWDQAMTAADAFVSEIEARCAEEQRRKDAEGQEPFAYVSQEDANTPKNAHGLEQFGEYCDKKYEYFQVPLYTHPANVAALKARVKVLEDVGRGYLKTQDVIHEKGLFGASLDEFNLRDAARDSFRAALTREGGE
ncbi:hypothetical protein [Gluconobacter morbifer]|uniref:hypothetical protein n=1 Tax=Gluconobacter morbifer TaxID=479935 RepID=UPI001112B4BE|nr:hypothetical protein [Gluconobacter morbifer]